MPSSISSSEGMSASAVKPRWAVAWLIALVLAAAISAGAEYHWRALNYRPNVRDSAQLWSIERDRAYASDKTPLLLLGASRIEFAVDMHLLRELLPNYQPVMLAQNAHYPLAALRDLAADERFHGVVLCDLEAGGLYKMYTDMQQPLVDYYHRQWAPSWHLHRLLLTHWQHNAVIADADLGLVASAVRLLDGSAPPRPDYFRFHPDRSGDIDYTLTDAAAAKKHFGEVLANSQDLHAAVAPEQWRADLAQVYEWTKRIQARGGKVIFYQSPTGPTLTQIEALRHPKALYWDRFAADSPAPVLDAMDDPVLRTFELPDDSHLDYRSKPAYTRALVEALVERGWLQR
jgi:hypothetical protein